MAIRNLTPPTISRNRKSKHNFSEKDVSDSVKMLEDGGNPGVGPFKDGDEEKQIKDARSAIQGLLRAVQPEIEDKLGTKAWVAEDGAYAILRVVGE